MVKVALILGTKRPGRRSEKVAKYVQEIGSKIDDIEVNFVDPRDYEDITQSVSHEKLGPILQEADAYFIVSPEYNHSFPGDLKNILDTEYDTYEGKPVVIAGVSKGLWGGTRMIESLIPVLKALQLVILNKDIQFKKVIELFDNQGNITDDSYEDRVKSAFAAIKDYLNE